MELGTVIGSVWATKKSESITGQKLLVIDLIKERKREQESLIVAADVIGAGIGDLVLLCRGNSARLAAGGDHAPIDVAVVGIVDSLDIPAPSHREEMETSI